LSRANGEVEKVINRVAEVLKRHLSSPFRLILFGSFARGDGTPFSDVDLAVEVEGGVDPKVWNRILFELEELPTLRKIDLIDLKRAPESLKKVIEKEGVPVYGP